MVPPRGEHMSVFDVVLASRTLADTRSAKFAREHPWTHVPTTPEIHWHPYRKAYVGFCNASADGGPPPSVALPNAGFPEQPQPAKGTFHNHIPHHHLKTLKRIRCPHV